MPPPPAPPREPRPVSGRSARNRFAVDTTTESEGSGGESTRSMRSSASLPQDGDARRRRSAQGERLARPQRAGAADQVRLAPFGARRRGRRHRARRRRRRQRRCVPAPRVVVVVHRAARAAARRRHAARHDAAAESTADPARSSPPPETCGYACAHTLRGHAGAVFSLTSAKGQLFSAAQDAAVRVWPLGKGAAAAAAAEPPASVELVGHAGFVRALAVSGGGALLFSARPTSRCACGTRTRTCSSAR